jgi:molybdopterin-guanine dinucleotide biosynthesis protein A
MWSAQRLQIEDQRQHRLQDQGSAVVVATIPGAGVVAVVIATLEAFAEVVVVFLAIDCTK